MPDDILPAGMDVAKNPVVREPCAFYFVEGAVNRRAIRPRSTTTTTVAARPTHRKACSPGPAGGLPATPSRLPKVAPAQAQAKVMGAMPRVEARTNPVNERRVPERA